MEREAIDALPDVLSAIGFREGVLIGHSDGATIAAQYAGGEIEVDPEELSEAGWFAPGQMPDLPDAGAFRPPDSPRVRTVLYLGRLHPIKGLEDLLRAWAARRICAWVGRAAFFPRSMVTSPKAPDRRRCSAAS